MIRDNTAYYSDGKNNYLVVRLTDQNLENYQYKMLAINKIPGILPASLRLIDGQGYLYYDISGKQPFEPVLQGRILHRREVLGILHAVASAQETMAGFLMDGARVMLYPEDIYLDLEQKKYCFAYYPGTPGGEENMLEYLLGILLEHVKQEDRETQTGIYRLLDQAITPGFVLDLEILKKAFCRQEEVFPPDPDREETDPGQGIIWRTSQEVLEDDPEERNDRVPEGQQETRIRENMDGAEEKMQENERVDGSANEEEAGQPASYAALVSSCLFLVLALGIQAIRSHVVLDARTMLVTRALVVGTLSLSMFIAAAGFVRCIRREGGLFSDQSIGRVLKYLH